MRLTAVALVLCATVLPILAGGELLGADDVDMKHAEEASPTPNPTPPREPLNKHDAKMVRVDMQGKKAELKALKLELKNAVDLPKAEKEAKRRRFNLLKQEIKLERMDLTKYAVEEAMLPKTETSRGGKKVKGRKDGKKKSSKDGKVKGRKHTKKDRDTLVVEPELDAVTQTSPPLTKEQMKEQKRAQRKLVKQRERKERKGVKPDMLMGETVEASQMMADAPQLPTREVVRTGDRKAKKERKNKKEKKQKKEKSGKKHRSCVTHTDCQEGEVCSANRKGNKACFASTRMDRKENKKCLSTAQCGRSLKCFVANEAVATRDGRLRGMCKDPTKMVDAEKQLGNFLAV